MRLGKREQLERAGSIGVGVEKRGLSGGVVVNAGPRDRIVGGGAADCANDVPCGLGALRYARRSEPNSGARPPESEKHHCEEGAERERPAEGLAEEMAAEIRRFLFFEAGRTEIVGVGTAAWQTRLYRKQGGEPRLTRLAEPADLFQPLGNALLEAAAGREIVTPAG